MSNWNDKLQLFDTIVETCPEFERKGKSMIYCSANGYMFALLNKAGEIGVRLSKPSQEAFKAKYNTSEYRSYGAVMKDYVLIPDSLLTNSVLMTQLFTESYNYVMSLKPK
ncbi:hypothetical protein [Hanstruepera flava]|uniref:hypothetical protein n=1 Tax=Hanstruepera flava TaxID=2930218 RepID=UPI002028B076|nr:hypothetical protein [Hanstruepera flava]